MTSVECVPRSEGDTAVTIPLPNGTEIVQEGWNSSLVNNGDDEKTFTLSIKHKTIATHFGLDRMPDGYPYDLRGYTAIEWDGDANGKTTVYSEMSGLLVKVSDLTPSVDDFSGGFYRWNAGELSSIGSRINEYDGGVGRYGIYVVYEPNAEIEDVVFPEAGFYFPLQEFEGERYYITSFEYWSTDFKPLAPKFLPFELIIITDVDGECTCNMTRDDVSMVLGEGKGALCLLNEPTKYSARIANSVYMNADDWTAHFVFNDGSSDTMYILDDSGQVRVGSAVPPT